MRKIFGLAFLVALTGCASDKVLVRSLDSAFIEAAHKAKAAGAKELTVELSVVDGYKGTASVPISVVTVGGEKTVSNSIKVTAKIADLGSWIEPVKTKGAEDYFILDVKTFKLEEPTNQQHQPK